MTDRNGIPDGTEVTYVGDSLHAAPPILVGMEGKVHGKVERRISGGLYKVMLTINTDTEATVLVQLHQDQLQPKAES